MKNSFRLGYLIFILFTSLGISSTALTAETISPVYKVRVIRVETIQETKHQLRQSILARFTTGPYQGKTIQLKNESNGFLTDLQYQPGNLLFVQAFQNNGLLTFAIVGPAREDALYQLIFLFLLGVVLLGGLQGIRAVISLIMTGLAIYYLLIPLLIKGVHPIPLTLILAALATVFTLFLVSGLNQKTLAAVIGTISGVTVAGLLAWYFGQQALLTGAGDESFQRLHYTSQSVNGQGLLFAGIIIGALGAVMDVAMSISSAMTEIKKNNPSISPKTLIRAGFKVGKDVIGTMTNTLVLAYAGSSFPLLILYHLYQTPYSRIINHDSIAAELVRMFAGSLGLLTTIPVTVFATAVLSENMD